MVPSRGCLSVGTSVGGEAGSGWSGLEVDGVEDLRVGMDVWVVVVGGFCLFSRGKSESNTTWIGS